MKRIATIVLAGIVLASCAHKSATVELFNGKDLQGWQFIIDGDSVPASDVYSISDGNIRIAGQPFGYMYTDAVYSDYDLEVEWAWEGEGTNSGVFINIGATSNPFPECIECNLQKGKAGKYVLLGGATAEEFIMPEDGVMPKFPSIEMKEKSSEKPDGEWNLTRIEVRGAKITSYVNGVLQNECTGSRSEGHIGLQSEGGPILFRRVSLTNRSGDKQ